MTVREQLFAGAFLVVNCLIAEAVFAAFAAAVFIILSARRFVSLLEGALTFAVINVAVLLAIQPLLRSPGHQLTRLPYMTLILLLIGLNLILLYRYSPSEIFEKLSELNRRAEVPTYSIFLAAILISAWAFPGWRAFDREVPRKLAQTASHEHPNIVLITFDAFAEDETSLFDSRLATTPILKQLSRRSYYFSRFSSVCSFTTPSVASLLTGKYPVSHRVFQLEAHIPAQLRQQNLAKVLQDNGYATAAIVGNPIASPLHLGIDDSFGYIPKPVMSNLFLPATIVQQVKRSTLFEQYLYMIGHFLKVGGWMFRSFNENPWTSASSAFAQGEDFIAKTQQPFFLWIHSFPPHSAYVAGPRFKGKFLGGGEYATQNDFSWLPIALGPYPASYQPTVDKLRARYHESMAQVDSDLGEFLDWMSHNKLTSNTIVIVTADHGESFYGWLGHQSPNLRYSELHIPLFIALPGQKQSAEITSDADLTAIAPTILDLAGIPVPPWMDGHSLAPCIKGDCRQSVAGFANYLAASSTFEKPRRGTLAVTSGKYKLTWYFPENKTELYDIEDDPDQKVDLSGKEPGPADSLSTMIRQRFGSQLEN